MESEITVPILKPILIDGKISYDNLWHYIKLYVEEVFETSFIFILLYIFSGTKLGKGKIIGYVFIISFITFIAELYQPVIKKNIKGGISTTVGSMFIKNIFMK